MKKILLTNAILLLTAMAYGQWQQTSGPLGNAINCMTSSGTNIFAGTAGSGIYLSSDDGINWTGINSGLTHMNIKAIAADENGNLFAGTNSLTLYTSGDTGSLWTPHNMGGTGTAISSITFYDTLIFAGEVGDGIFKSLNAGSTWTEVGLCCASVLSVCADTSGYVYAGTSSSVYRSSGVFTNWLPMSNGMPANSVRVLMNSGNLIFAGTYGSGVYVTANHGSVWTSVSSGLNDLHIISMTSIGNKIFAGTDAGGVFLSVDNGTGWMPVNEGLSSLNIPSLTVCGAYVYAGTAAAGIWKRPLSELTGITEELLDQEQSMNIYPNPAGDMITLMTMNKKAAMVVVSDMQGKLILEQSVETPNTQLNISGLEKGMYLIRLTNSDETITQRFIKNH